MSRVSLAVLCLTLMVTPSRGQYHVVKSLAEELTDSLGTHNGRLQSVADVTQIRAKRLTALIGSAEALYSWVYNQLLLDGDLIGPDGAVRTLHSLVEVRGGYLNAVSAVGTILHELAHAEYDHCIEERSEPEDERLWRVLQDEVRPWLATNEPALRNLPRWLVETHGYFVEACYRQALFDRHDILRAHGLDPRTATVDDLGRQRLRALIADGRLQHDDFGRFVPALVTTMSSDAVWTRSYVHRVRGFSVWALNGTTALASQHEVTTSRWTAERGFADAWWDALWRHLRHYHGLPSSAAELLRRMQESMGPVLANLAAEQRRVAAELGQANAEEPHDGFSSLRFLEP